MQCSTNLGGVLRRDANYRRAITTVGEGSQVSVIVDPLNLSYLLLYPLMCGACRNIPAAVD